MRLVFTVIDALHSAYGNVRNTKVGMSLRMTRRRALASETLMRSIVKLSWPFSSVLETIRGMYLETAEAEWKGALDSDERADDDATAADILSLNNNNGTVYIILVKQLDSNQFFL